MGYESLSTIVVLVIVAMVIAIWLPVRTSNGMKRVAEHRQDRYSPSLHIVEVQDGSRFGDAKPHQAKGAAVPASSTSAKLTEEHIAHVRKLRRAAVRRRQIIAGSLLAVTAIVLVIAVPLHFSLWFALIPFALLIAVLVMGVRASRQAREWERRVARYERSRRKTAKAVAAHKERLKQAQAAKAIATAESENVQHVDDDASTEVLEQRQIRRALHDAEVEAAKAKALRAAAAKAEQAGEQAADAQPVAAAVAEPAQEHSEAEAATHHSVEPSLTVRDERDATSELATVHPARPLESSLDLISFSLGSAPESLEIKSTRQVAKAEPVAPQVAEQLIDEAKAVKAADDAQAAAKAAVEAAAAIADAADGVSIAADSNATAVPDVTDADAFHKQESQADVEAPAATSDSLGAGLAGILSRRGN
ncbi:magnesium transporter [Bifidobacterium oedipodis]|uniref:Membrane-associated protein n=1 Tax=Bifidobacterium oedipodis TaxID=2675322 RepID=A0A7Y0EQJ4_9BIFI|nr:magnesium transporter [Bifidobacterium sp. DSM 109957]NMM94626.1 hypothetical protein [Bifidobacterium sp. DSM 109957]